MTKTVMILAAERFCQIAHSGQKRKYTEAPYWSHPFEVAAIVRKYLPDHEIAAITALLHDVVEDTKYTAQDIEKLFGRTVAQGVTLLTNTPPTEGMNRARRKEMDRIVLSAAPDWVQSVKVADIISNTRDITVHDPEFAKVYMKEKQLLMEALKQANPALRDIANNQINCYYKKHND